MKIPKVFHPILGVLLGTIMFLAGIAAVSCVFVLAYKGILFAKPYIVEIISHIRPPMFPI